MAVSIILRSEIERTKCYKIHDNIGNFEVEVGPRHIRIFNGGMTAAHELKYPDTYCIIRNFEGVFVGISDQNEDYTGNCVLIHLAGNRYIYAGYAVYEFTTLEPVTRLVGHVGRDGSVYPYVETDTYIYYLSEYEDKFWYTHKKNAHVPDIQLTRIGDMKETDEEPDIGYEDYPHDAFIIPSLYLFENLGNDRGGMHAFYQFEPIPILTVKLADDSQYVKINECYRRNEYRNTTPNETNTTNETSDIR